MGHFLSKKEFVMIYSERRRLFARAETGITRCNGVKPEEKGGWVGWEIKTALTVRAIRQRNGLCELELSLEEFVLDKKLRGGGWGGRG